MTNVHFYLKYSKSKESKIICKFSYLKRRQYPTSFKVPVSQWNSKLERLEGRGIKVKNINDVLMYVKDSINKLLLDAELYTAIELNQKLKQVCKAKEVNQSFSLKSIMTIENKKHEIFESELLSNVQLVDYKNTLPFHIEKYISDNEKKITQERLGQYLNCLKKIKLMDLHIIHIDNWSKKEFDIIVDNFLYNKLKNTTINQHIKIIEAVLKVYNSNHKAIGYKKFKLPKIPKMSLTKSELTILKELNNLTKKMEHTRDVFLFACSTGQRISDVKLLRKSEINNSIWSFNSQKSKKIVSVKIGQTANEILQKYNYELPTVSDQKNNDYLKELFKHAGLNRIFNNVSYSGLNKINDEQPIYKLVGSHTARRTFITQSLINNVPISIIATATGLTLKTIETYNNTDAEILNDYYSF